MGFALEHFDAIGKWRTRGEDNADIDASAVLPDGTKFQGLAGLKAVLLGRQRELVRTVTEKLMTYALGRGVEYYDQPALRQVMQQASPSDYRWTSIILGIVQSAPFQMRRAES